MKPAAAAGATLLALQLAGSLPVQAAGEPIVRSLGGVRADAAALLSSGAEGGALQMAIAALPFGPERSPGKTRVLVVAAFGGESLVASHPGGRLGIELSVYALGADRRIAAAIADGIAVDLTGDGALERTGLRYVAELELPPGEASIRVLARVRQTGAFGLRTLRVQVPRPGEAAPAPAAAGGTTGWLDALAPGLDRGDHGRLAAAGAIPSPLGAGTEIGAEIVATIDGVEETRTPEPLAPAAASPGDVEAATAVFRVAYRRFGAGERSAAVAELQAFEGRIVAADRQRGMGTLARADGALLKEIAQDKPDLLLPLGLLYRDLLRAHLAAGRVGLARRAGGIAEDQIVAAGERATEPEERRLAAAALDGLAADYLEIRSPVRAAGLLERAGALDPRRAGRWLALGALRENDHRWPEALRAFERALEVEPRNREARLRRARVDRERESPRRAAEGLDALLAEPDRDWVAVVAAQERARLWIDQERIDLAAEVLATAAGRFPDEPALALALAWARHRTGERPAALAAAERAAGAARAFRLAPRRRYAEPPTVPLAESASEAERAALLRFADLAAAFPERKPG